MRALQEGFSGVLEGHSPECARVSVFVNRGKILGAQSDDDALTLLRILDASAALPQAQVEWLRDNIHQAQDVVRLFEGHVPADVLSAVLLERARENLLAYLRLKTVPTRRAIGDLPSEGLPFDQTPAALLQALREEVRLTEALEGQLACSIIANQGLAATPEERRIYALCAPSLALGGMTPQMTLFGLLARSPWERTRTLLLVRTLIAANLLSCDAEFDIPGALPPRRLHPPPPGARPAPSGRPLDARPPATPEPVSMRASGPRRLKKVQGDRRGARTLAPMDDSGAHARPRPSELEAPAPAPAPAPAATGEPWKRLVLNGLALLLILALAFTLGALMRGC